LRAEVRFELLPNCVSPELMSTNMQITSSRHHKSHDVLLVSLSSHAKMINLAFEPIRLVLVSGLRHKWCLKAEDEGVDGLVQS
jgi:hypothetical protein